MRHLKAIGGLNVLFKDNFIPVEALEYLDRVIADSGVVDDGDVLNDIVRFYRDENLLSSTKLLAAPFLGYKLRESGIYKFLSKLYSFELPTNDLTQTTELNQPYQSGNIAPNEVLSSLVPNGDTRFLTSPEISFAANEAWSYTKVLNTNSTSATTHVICSDSGGNSKLFIKSTTNRFAITNASNTTVAGIGLIKQYIGKTIIVTFVARGDGSLRIYLNRILFDILTVAADFVFEKIEGNIYGYLDRLQSGAMTATQVAAEHIKLRTYIPEVETVDVIETVDVSTLKVATSNYQAVATPAGNVIAEVQLAATWATAEDTYNTTYAATVGTADEKHYAALKAAAMWCSYDNSTANQAIYGKLFNQYAVELFNTDFAARNFGYHIPTEAELATILAEYTDANDLKKEGTNYWDNALGTNESGLTLLGTGCRMPDGSFASIKKVGGFATSDGNVSKQLGLPIRILKINDMLAINTEDNTVFKQIQTPAFEDRVVADSGEVTTLQYTDKVLDDVVALNPSLVMVPSGYKDSKLYSQVPYAGGGDFTVTRSGTTGMRLNNGYWQPVAANVPRVNLTWNEATQMFEQSLLIEEARTNLIAKARTFSDAAWAKFGATVEGGYACPFVDANGANTNEGYDVVATADNGYVRLATPLTIIAGTTYTDSLFIKRISGTGQISLIDINTADRAITLTSEWQRFDYAAVAESTSGQAGVKLAVSGDVIQICYSAVEAAATASSPIYGAETGTQTRNADVIVKTGAADLIGQTEGWILFESDGSDIEVFGLVAKGASKGLFNYDGTDIELYADGELADSATGTYDWSGMDSVVLGSYAGSYLNGRLKVMECGKTKLTAAVAASLT